MGLIICTLKVLGKAQSEPEMCYIKKQGLALKPIRSFQRTQNSKLQGFCWDSLGPRKKNRKNDSNYLWSIQLIFKNPWVHCDSQKIQRESLRAVFSNRLGTGIYFTEDNFPWTASWGAGLDDGVVWFRMIPGHYIYYVFYFSYCYIVI